MVMIISKKKRGCVTERVYLFRSHIPSFVCVSLCDEKKKETTVPTRLEWKTTHLTLVWVGVFTTVTGKYAGELPVLTIQKNPSAPADKTTGKAPQFRLVSGSTEPPNDLPLATGSGSRSPDSTSTLTRYDPLFRQIRLTIFFAPDNPTRNSSHHFAHHKTDRVWRQHAFTPQTRTENT